MTFISTRSCRSGWSVSREISPFRGFVYEALFQVHAVQRIICCFGCAILVCSGPVLFGGGDRFGIGSDLSVFSHSFFCRIGNGPRFGAVFTAEFRKKEAFGDSFSFFPYPARFVADGFYIWHKKFSATGCLFRPHLYPILFVASVISFFVFYVLEAVLVAFKRTGALVATDILQYFPRIVFLPLMVGWGGSGIYFANGLSAALAVVAGLFFMRDKMGPGNGQSGFDPGLLRETLPLSLVNFFSSATLFLPGVLIPLVIVRWFSEREAGFFYLPWMMFSVYASFLGSATGTLLMKASHGEDPEPLFKNRGCDDFGCRRSPCFSLFAPAIPGSLKGISTEPCDLEDSFFVHFLFPGPPDLHHAL